MHSRDLRDLQLATREIYSTFFSTKVEYRFLLEDNETDIYGELKRGDRKYSEPIILTASVDMNPNSDEIRADLGANQRVDAIFEVPTIDLEEFGVNDKPPSEIKKGILTFNNIEYEILGLFPVTNVDEKFLFYKFETCGKNV